MRTWAVRIAVGVAVVAAALLLRRDSLPESPEQAVADLFDAAGRGDDAGYLRVLGGDLSASVRQTRSQLGTEAFRENLRRSAAGIKGIAVSRVATLESDAVALDVEIVFTGRNERQRVLCEPTGRGWAITEMAAAEMEKPAIAYGTPVFDEGAAQEVPKRSPRRNKVCGR